MKRLLVFSAAVLLAPALAAQPANLSIAAPQNYVVAARSLPLSVRVVNGRGAVLRDRSFEWQVNNPARARIDENGVLFGLSPGVVEVTVTDRDSGATGSRSYNVYPGSISVEPAEISVQQGEKRKLAAFARDADGKVLSGVPFQWHSDLPSLATVASDGTISGVAEGRATVSAAPDLGPAYSRFSAFVAVRVLRRPGYRLRSVVSSDAAASGTSVLAPTRVSAAGNYAAALTSLSNGGQALLLWQNGRAQTLLTAGARLNGRLVASLDSLSVNAQGDVVVLANGQAEWCEHIVALFPAGSRTPKILDDTTRCSYWSLTPNALGAQQSFVYRHGNTLYQRKGEAPPQALLNIGDKPPGVDVVTNIQNWSVAPSGRVLVDAQDSAGVSVYLVWDGTRFQKLYTSADQMFGAYRAQYSALPIETAPDEYFTTISGGNWSSAARLKRGQWTAAAFSGQDNIGWIHTGRGGASGDAVYFVGDRDGKTKLFRNTGTSNEVVGSYASWREIDTVLGAGGDAVVLGAFDGPTRGALRFSGTSSTPLFETGLRIDTAAAPAIGQFSIPKGFNAAAPYLRTSGDTLLRAGSSGVTTFLKPGDALPGGGALSQLGGMASNRLGDLVFTAAHGATWAVYSLRAGQLQRIADGEDRLGRGGAIVYGFPQSDYGQLAMNNAGHVAAMAYNSFSNGVFLFSGPNSASSAQPVALHNDPLPGAVGRIGGVGSIAIDEADRVAFVAYTTTGKTGLFVWDQGRITQILEVGQRDPVSGRAYGSINSLQAAGSRFFARVGLVGLSQQIAVEGTAVRVLASDGITTSFGSVVSWIFGGDVAANSRGDIVFPVVTPAGPMLLVKRADGTDVQVAAADTRGPDGEWFLNLYGPGISEQGDVLFATDVWVGGQIRLALYQASVN
jgi:hypothetical protein